MALTLQDTPTSVLRDQLRSGAVSATALAQACIARIAARDAEVRAWAWFDADAALRDAARLDALRASGAPLGPLHGLPVGVKDVIDTAGIPTENGCPFDKGRVPATDAAVVAHLKAAGAMMFGKTVTTELAFLHPGATRNPVNPLHTPGGSSSGSAAAVADSMVPFGIGTQTGGSVVRPASFCGVVGYKPTFNALPRDGVLLQSHSLDTLGVFAGDPFGAALLADALRDPDGPMPLSRAVAAGRTRPPVLGFVTPPEWERADPALHDAMARFRHRLGDIVVEARLPDIFESVVHQRGVMNTAEMGHHFQRYLAADSDQLGPPTRATIENGQSLSADAYIEAVMVQKALPAALAPIFDTCDAILCPAALGPAPEGLASTGDSVFNGLWTMAGTPAITLPLLTAPNGLPMGVQLVGQVGDDAGLLNTAQWLWTWAASDKGRAG